MSEAWVAPRSARWPRPVGAMTTTTAWHGASLWERSSDRDREIAPTVVAVQRLTQIHGSRCVEARLETVGEIPEADAAWTRERGLALMVVTADCVPVVICDRAATVVGVAHGGWRGLVGGVLENLVASLPVPPAELMAWLGPAIGPSVYEVGEDVASAVRGVPEGEQLARDCLHPGAPGKHYLDLFILSQRLLHRAGVGEISTERLCTYSDRRFYSYRRDGATGRMATLGWLQEAV